MYDPKFRLTLLISIVGTIYTIYNLCTSIFDGLNIVSYLTGLLYVGGAAAGGMLFVWICYKRITFDQFRKSGFEATKTIPGLHLILRFL